MNNVTDFKEGDLIYCGWGNDEGVYYVAGVSVDHQWVNLDLIDSSRTALRKRVRITQKVWRLATVDEAWRWSYEVNEQLRDEQLKQLKAINDQYTSVIQSYRQSVSRYVERAKSSGEA